MCVYVCECAEIDINFISHRVYLHLYRIVFYFPDNRVSPMLLAYLRKVGEYVKRAMQFNLRKDVTRVKMNNVEKQWK